MANEEGIDTLCYWGAYEDGILTASAIILSFLFEAFLMTNPIFFLKRRTGAAA